MAPATSSQTSNPNPTLTTQVELCLRALRAFRVASKSKSSAIKQAEILLTVEAARLFTWGVALGIISIIDDPGMASEQPSIVPELTSYYRQQSIGGVLQTLHNLLTDVDLIQKAYGCLPMVPNKTTSVKARTSCDFTTAGVRLSSAFRHFVTSTTQDIKVDAAHWTINNDKKFSLFVAEIRTLVSQLNGMTENLLPPPVQNAMIYTRVWEVRSSWAATAIADACEDIYIELSLHARDLAEVLDMEDAEVGRNVCNFIGYWNSHQRTHGFMSHGEDEYDRNRVSNRHTETRLRALELRVLGALPHALPCPDPTIHGKGPSPAGAGPRNDANLHESSFTNMGTRRGSHQVSDEPKHIHSAGKLHLKAEPVDSGAASIARPPSPMAWPMDESVIVKGPKPAPVSQARLQEQMYTPSTSSSGHRRRDARRAEVWDDDLSSSSSLSDGDDVAGSLARTGSPPRYRAEKWGAAPRDVPMRGAPTVKQMEAFEEWKKQCAGSNSRSAATPQSEPVRSVENPEWLGPEIKKELKHRRTRNPVGDVDDIWEFEVPAGKPTTGKDHDLCDNCGVAMDESGHRL